MSKAKENISSSADENTSMRAIAEALGSFRSKGVSLWTENGRLHYRGPKDTLTSREVEWLRARKHQIVAFLDEAASTGAEASGAPSRSRPDYIPLTYSQLARWRRYQNNEQHPIRQVASATRVLGRLDLNAFHHSAQEIIRRHDALRTRILVRDGVPYQLVDSFEEHELDVCDLSGLARQPREEALKQLIDEFILQPIDLAIGPLFGIRLARIGDAEHVVIVAMEHMISDMGSLRVLAKDLFAAYAQAVRQRPIVLPAIAVQFPDYAVSESNLHPSWMQRHGQYWKECATRLGRTRFPEDVDRRADFPRGWGAVAIHIDKELKRQLLGWCRWRQTTLVLSVFTAYVALVMRWCRASESMFQYAIDGRVHEGIKDTIGYFATVLFIRAEIRENDNFLSLLNRVTVEFCRAYEHADHSYLMAQIPRPGFTRNSAFNWIPKITQGYELELNQAQDSVVCAPVTFEHPAIRNLSADNEPSILLYDTEEEVTGSLYFPKDRFSITMMEGFSREFLVFLRTLVERPETLISTVSS